MRISWEQFYRDLGRGICNRMRGVVYVGGPSTATHCKSGAPQYMTGQPQPHGALEWVKNDIVCILEAILFATRFISVGYPPLYHLASI